MFAKPSTVSITLSPAVMVQRAVVLAALAPLVAAPPPDVLQPPRGATFDDIFPSDGRPERFTASRHLWESFVNHGYLDELHVSSNPGQLCDIGAADGSLTHFISRSFGMQSVAYDIVPPDDNLYSLGEAQSVSQGSWRTLRCQRLPFCWRRVLYPKDTLRVPSDSHRTALRWS